MVWCGDLTYIPTDEGWLYLASVIDLASRHLVGWSMGTHHDAGLVCDALQAAVTTRGCQRMDATIFHSDSEYVGPVLLGFLTRTAMDARGCWCRDAPKPPDPHADRRAARAVFPRIRRWPGSTRRGARLVDGVT